MTDKDPFFRQAVYDIVAMVPCGRATSYGAIARAIGHPNLSRMVGRVMSSMESAHGLPAHRVVNSSGILSGRAAFGDPTLMQSLLEEEGVTVKNHRISNWKTVFWDPQKEIDI